MPSSYAHVDSGYIPGYLHVVTVHTGRSRSFLEES
jgi:hypothetical protein